MRKRNAILLCLAFVLLMAGYVAWCWRGFYLRASFDYSAGVPEDARVILENWRKNDPHWEPVPFSSRLAVGWLIRPWASRRQVDVDRLGIADRIVVSDQGHTRSAHVFLKYDGRWQID